jgi:hypothetical protein
LIDSDHKIEIQTDQRFDVSIHGLAADYAESNAVLFEQSLDLYSTFESVVITCC